MMTITFSRPRIGSTTVTYSKLTNSPTVINTAQWPAVANQTRCFVKCTSNGFQMLPYCSALYSAENIKKLAVVVESPNSKEFDNNFNPIAPLIGRSGNVFDRKIIGKLNGWFNILLRKVPDFTEEMIVQIKIFNPVQFQTSLFHLLNNKIPYLQLQQSHKKYMLNQKLRDDVWKALYIDLQYENDFIAEILKYAPNYIVNCCTGSSSSPVTIFRPISGVAHVGTKELKDIVRNTLCRTFNMPNVNVLYIEDWHPRAW